MRSADVDLPPPQYSLRKWFLA